MNYKKYVMQLLHYTSKKILLASLLSNLFSNISRLISNLRII